MSESVDQEKETLEIDEVTVKGMIAEMLKKQDEIFESLTTRIGKIESEQQRLKILEGYPGTNEDDSMQFHTPKKKDNDRRSSLVTRDLGKLLETKSTNQIIHTPQRASDAFIAKETEKINQKNNNKDLIDKFCKGEWVLIRKKNHEKGKLDLPWKGPYVVISHMGNDVSIYDEVQQKEVNKEHVDNVKSYLGSTEQALDAARSSAKESEIKKILYHEGDPNKRTSMSFVLQYKDGSISLPLVYGLVKYTAVLEQYVKGNKDLLPLRYESAAEWQKNQQTYKYNIQAIKQCILEKNFKPSRSFSNLEPEPPPI